MPLNSFCSQIKSKKFSPKKYINTILFSTLLTISSYSCINNTVLANDPFYNNNRNISGSKERKTKVEKYQNQNQKILDDTHAEATELGHTEGNNGSISPQNAMLALNYNHQTNSIMSLFWQADIVVKSIMILLLFASIYSWTIIVNRITIFSNSNKKIKKFEELFWSGQPLDSILKRTISSGDPAPTAIIFIAAMEELNAKNSTNSHAKNLKLRLENSVNIAANRALYSLQEGFSGLAITSLVSPFVGLFGTVWGIMNTFPKIAASKHVTIATVAPGMAEALLATAIGLLAAIPACIFYNKFNSDLQHIEGKVDEFKGEIMNIILRDLEENQQ